MCNRPVRETLLLVRVTTLSHESSIWTVVFGSQATREVKLHAVYVVLFLGFPLRVCALLFGKSKSTISNWVAQYKKEGDCHRKVQKSNATKLFDYHRSWIVNFVLHVDPLAYLHEVRSEFQKVHGFYISLSCISRLLMEEWITKKVIERRAMEIRQVEIARFTIEVCEISPLFEQLLFMDEMSTDNRSMVRKKGWFMKNSCPVFFGIFRRSKRISILAFLGVDGLVDYFQTNGTFDRFTFFTSIRKLLQSGKIQKFPGRHSVWVLDGASIHRDPSMIEFLWSMGVKVVFLPAYCPFFMPIEILFGLVKRDCRKLYNRQGTELLVLATVLSLYSSFDFGPIFTHCGYCTNGKFDPNVSIDLTSLSEGDLEMDDEDDLEECVDDSVEMDDNDGLEENIA